MRIMKCRVGQYAEAVATVPGFVYAGRAFGGYPGSHLANPCRKGAKCPVCAAVHTEPKATIPCYRKWLWQRLRWMEAVWQSTPEQRTDYDRECADVYYALDALTEDTVLGCWCVDKAEAGTGSEECHCDVLAKARAWLQRQTQQVGGAS